MGMDKTEGGQGENEESRRCRKCGGLRPPGPYAEDCSCIDYFPSYYESGEEG